MKNLSSEKEVLVCNLGITRYSDAWDLQRELFQLRVEGKIPDILLLTEHANVYTIGKTGTEDHLLASKAELQQENVEVFQIDRGGDITYHGPGQLVAYPILDLQDYYLDVHRYLRDLEEVIILTLGEYGITSERDPRYTGVWVEGRKIAAIGVKVSRWVTMHGVAVNVNSDLSFFDRIIPCGIADRGVTSVERILSRRVDLEEFGERFVDSFGQVFGIDSHPIGLGFLRTTIAGTPKEKELCPQ